MSELPPKTDFPILELLAPPALGERRHRGHPSCDGDAIPYRDGFSSGLYVSDSCLKAKAATRNSASSKVAMSRLNTVSRKAIRIGCRRLRLIWSGARWQRLEGELLSWPPRRQRRRYHFGLSLERGTRGLR